MITSAGSAVRAGRREHGKVEPFGAITEEQRRRWVQLLIETADEVGLPEDPEFRAAFVGYLEWGSRMAVLLSAPDAEGDLAEPMPTWTWILPPWQPTS